MQAPFLNTLDNHSLPAEQLQQNEQHDYEINGFMQNEYYAPSVIQTQQNLWTESDEQATNYTNFLLQQQAHLSRRTSTLGTLPKYLPVTNYLQRHLVLTSNGLAPPFRERERLTSESEFDDNSQKMHSVYDTITTNNVISNPNHFYNIDANKQQRNVDPCEAIVTEHNAQRTYPGLAHTNSIQGSEYATHFSNVGGVYRSANCFLDNATSFYKMNSAVSPSTKNQSRNFVNNRSIGNVPNSFYYKPGSFYNLQLNKTNSMYNNNNNNNDYNTERSEQNIDLLPYSASDILHTNSQQIRLGLVRKASITNFSYSFKYLGEDDTLHNDEEETANDDILYSKQTAPLQHLKPEYQYHEKELDKEKWRELMNEAENHRKVSGKHEVQQSEKSSQSKEERKRNIWEEEESEEEEEEEQEEEEEEKESKVQEEKVYSTFRKDNQRSDVTIEEDIKSINQSEYEQQIKNKLNLQSSQKEKKEQESVKEEVYTKTDSSSEEDKETSNAEHAEID